MTITTDPVFIRYWPDEDDLFRDHAREFTLHFDALVPGGGECASVLTVSVLMYGDHTGTIIEEPLSFGPDVRHYEVPVFLPEGGTDPVFRLAQATGPVEVTNLRVVTDAATVTYTSPDDYQVTAAG